MATWSGYGNENSGGNPHEDEGRRNNLLRTTTNIIGHDCQVEDGDTTETLGAAIGPLEIRFDHFIDEHILEGNEQSDLRMGIGGNSYKCW